MLKDKIDFPKKLQEIPSDVLKTIVELAIQEDMNTRGDITSISLLKNNRFYKNKACVITKQDGVVCGLKIFQYVYSVIDKNAECGVTLLKEDGDEVKKGDILIEIEGPAFVILSGERIALNFLGMLSGISTKTHRLTRALKGSKTKLLDTRKTIPGFRQLQKYAVQKGGGYNHRIGLYDMIMIKENHIKAVGSIKTAALKSKKEYPDVPIEIEVETLVQLKEALSTQADIIMLDNMDDNMVKQAVAINDGAKFLEVSGNITEDRLRRLADIGVDFISMGALTHTMKPLDISLLID